MKQLTTKSLAVAVTLLCSIGLSAQENPQGGLFLEPAVTYETASGGITYPGPLGSSSGSSDGFGLGARLGFHLNEAFFLGFDFRYAMPEFKDSTVNYAAKATSTNLGPVIGMQMPNVGMRLWASYVMDGELNPERSGNFDVKFRNANGYRVGAGFKVASVSVNAEYKQVTYGKTIVEQAGPLTGEADLDSMKLGSNGWLASISFPVAL